MSLFARLFRKEKEIESKIEPLIPLVQQDVVSEEPQAEEPAEDFWNMDPEEPAAVEEVAPAPVRNRRRRNATRILGFEGIEEETADPFDQAPSTVSQATMQFPTGWLTVIEGEGRGHSFCLTAGLNQIGRGEENSIQLDFGDTAISRKNHFSLVYDDDVKKFILGHGGKSNIVRLNDRPVISNEEIFDGDKVKVGSTILVVKTLCDENFDWNSEDNDKGQEDVAIA